GKHHAQALPEQHLGHPGNPLAQTQRRGFVCRVHAAILDKGRLFGYEPCERGIDVNSLIRNISLQNRVAPADQAAAFICDGMTVAMSGYAMAGYPKAVVAELVRRREAGEALSIHLVTGANVPALDEQLGQAGIIARRTPMCAHPALARQINAGSVHYVEQQMNKMPRLITSGRLGPIDVAVIEALGVDEQGGLIPTTSSGLSHLLAAAAETIIVEINTAQPEQLSVLHDIYSPEASPQTLPIPLVNIRQRIGRPSIPVDPEKIRAIVVHDAPERAAPPPAGTPETDRIAQHLFDLLEIERHRMYHGALPPLQMGFGSLATSIARSLAQSPFQNLQFFCGGVGEAILELLVSGKASAISTAGLEMSERVEEIIRSTPGLSDRLVIRTGDVINNAETIARMGLITLNTGIEIDVYGNVNSSHISG
ncbi:MAG: hypothetical protein EOM70_13785, partial [Clostridia bacterium]|nr:hypothetical protein [Clostridia bacterium]